MVKNWMSGSCFVSEFDALECQAYAGAEAFANGSNPVIASSDGGKGNPSHVVIGARQGIEVFCGSEGERGYRFAVELTQPMAVLLVALVMRDVMSLVAATLTLSEEREVFERYGFVQTCG
jgi:hypothetical protein